MRKKQHLSDLESQLTHLISKVNCLKQGGDTENSVSSHYRLEKQQLFGELKKLLDEGAADEDIARVLDTLRKKLGVMGVERQGYIEYLTHQICEVSLPYPLKQLLQSKGKDSWQYMLSGPEPEDNLVELEGMHKKYNNAIKSLKKARNCLLRRTRNLQNIIDYLANLLAPRQVAQLILRLNSSGASIDPW